MLPIFDENRIIFDKKMKFFEENRGNRFEFEYFRRSSQMSEDFSKNQNYLSNI